MKITVKPFYNFPRMELIALLMPCLIPIGLLVFSILGFHFTLHASSQKKRSILFPFTVYFEVLSFATAHNFSGIHPDLVGLWGLCLTFNLLHISSLLFIERVPAPNSGVLKGSGSRWFSSICTSYHFWSNPRLLPRSEIQENSKSRRQPLSVFIFLRFAKLIFYFLLHSKIVPLVSKQLIGVIYMSDVTSRKSSLLRLVRPSRLTSREVVLRAYMAVSWIWESFLVLDGANAALGLIAVTTGADSPDDWPPLFGKLSHISRGLRSFWGRFWHPLAVRPYRNYGRLIADGILSPLFRRGDRTRDSILTARMHGMITALIVFFLSGLSHMAVSWNLGMHDWLDVWWFQLNFAACATETAVLAILRGLAWRAGLVRELQEIENSWLGSLVGLSWVSMFFFWSVPLWRYERIYNSIEAAEQEMW
ncbi:hypothetical protein J7T55_007748 [Diaporthe amygdali]|uniref:uncharacterized protein n=1 Tax=Phomopsis amygdali TaxID=1214568 RepID=UPI0022FE0843|nr:uncharacterized protein J7T55_007748 [Diaporthe amygdali]KAJ0107558.1 hypothetical protein J7T55_007748 [Diaporthe amygdali]